MQISPLTNPASQCIKSCLVSHYSSCDNCLGNDASLILSNVWLIYQCCAQSEIITEVLTLLMYDVNEDSVSFKEPLLKWDLKGTSVILQSMRY